MQKTKDYLTLKGWKADLDETLRDFKDAGILVNRALGYPNYKLPRRTSREFKDFKWRASALWFDNEEDFQVYAMSNYWPLGRCLIGHGKNAKKYDDTVEIPKSLY